MGAKFEQLPGKGIFRGCLGRLPDPSSWLGGVPDQPVAAGSRLEPEQVC